MTTTPIISDRPSSPVQPVENSGKLADPVTADFIAAARCAFHIIIEALASGAWDPTPDRHPDFMIDRLESSLRESGFGTRRSDYARTEDLLEIAFVALDAGDWTGAPSDTVGHLQSAAFLTQLLSAGPELDSQP